MKTNNNFHILIVDDEKFNIELAAAYLKEEKYQLSFALNAKGTIEQVMKKEIDLILLDINMPGKDGFEVCEMLKSDYKTKDIPVIFLTAQTDIEYISRAFEVGGVDYISKPFNGIELISRTKTHLQNVAYLDSIKQKQSKLAQLSITDPLTKLYNALYFDAQIKSFQARDEKFWVIYLKIDRFEKINSVYGFYAANKIIRLFSKILKEVAYKNSKVARLYGISFGILLKDYDREEIKKLYEMIAVAILKDKDIGKVVTFSTVLYHGKDKAITLPDIYKTFQNAILKIGELNNEKFFMVD